MGECGKGTGAVSMFEKAAMNGLPMPDGLSMEEQMYFQGLSILYNRYRSGYISRDQGSADRKKLDGEFEKCKRKNELTERRRLQSDRMWKSAEGPSSDYVHARQAGDVQKALDAADRLWEAIYRMAFPLVGRKMG